ncbi:MAG TPA: hypothetical protein VGM23_15445 [Armatimonadota bacterium]|jgi:hypothetical protein
MQAGRITAVVMIFVLATLAAKVDWEQAFLPKETSKRTALPAGTQVVVSSVEAKTPEVK